MAIEDNVNDLPAGGNEDLGTAVPGEQLKLSPTQERALAQGWRPKDQWEGDEDEFIDAAEFVRRGELFSKIDSQSKELKDVKRALNELGKMHAKVSEVEYKRALDSLKAQKKQAMMEGDFDQVSDIEERIDLVKEQSRIPVAPIINEQPAASNAEFESWKSKNNWYGNDKGLTKYADARGVALAKEGYSPSDVLRAVEREVKEEFKEKFSNPNRNRAGAVEGSGVRPGGKGALDSYELTPQERQVMNTLVRQGVLTKEQYIKDLKAVKGID